jgi:adenylate kinase
MGVVGGHEGEAQVARRRAEDPVERRLLGEVVVLQLDVERARLEGVAEALELGAALALALLQDAQPVSAMRPVRWAAM